ncbi:MAG TPA: outer membrane beta-barrel protein [Steroidobacteraceae bacterium]|nr:outer membrane beta-barrel protein [Steroidobacteraceae bacterium]
MTRLAPGALLLALFSMAAHAADPAADPGADLDLGPRGGFLAQLDADFGGDDLATVYFEDDSSQDVKAGQGLTLSVGGYFRPIADSSFEIDASLGYKYVTTQADNADINVSRTVLQLGAYYRWPNGLHLGGGLVEHLGPELNGDGFFQDVQFDDATGFNLEIGWRWISLHYTGIKYTNDVLDFFGEEVDASNVGLRFTWRFGQAWTN